jgi:hypothetical protein
MGGKYPNLDGHHCLVEVCSQLSPEYRNAEIYVHVHCK